MRSKLLAAKPQEYGYHLTAATNMVSIIKTGLRAKKDKVWMYPQQELEALQSRVEAAGGRMALLRVQLKHPRLKGGLVQTHHGPASTVDVPPEAIQAWSDVSRKWYTMKQVRALLEP